MMARKDFLSDIDCPQFVDFAAGLDDQEDVFFDFPKQEFSTPTSAISRAGRRSVSTKFIKQKNRFAFDQNQRGSKIKNSQISCKTPKPSIKETKKQLERSPCVNLERQLPSDKKSQDHPRRRSRSENGIKNVIKSEVGFCVPVPCKRSLSADDVRIKKKTTYPTTPMCLKRPKKDKVIKTSEQIELEKIAQLQKELTAHLRFNEMSMKRLGLRKRINHPPIEQPVKAPLCFVKPLEPPKEVDKFHHCKRINASNNLRKIDEEIRSKFRNSKAAPLLSVPRAKVIGSQKENSGLSHSSRNVSTISCSFKSDSEKSIDTLPRRPLGIKNTGFHSGITFSSNYQKVTVVKPFTFNKPEERSFKAVNNKLPESIPKDDRKCPV